MKKLLATLFITTTVFAGVQAISADQTLDGKTAGDVTVNGTLGADNTDPGTSIPETSHDWINVTIPTDTIFYNTASKSAIQSPTYKIINHSGRPVKVSTTGFTPGATNGTLPTDFDLTLNVTGTTANPATTASTELVKAGVVKTAVTSDLITLANSANQFKASDTAATAVDNQATFTFGGTATSTTPLVLNYTLSLKFDAVSF